MGKGLHWKYRLRLALVPKLARLGRCLGFSWEKLGEKLGRETLIAQMRSLRSVRVVDAAPKPLDVVFLTMMGGNEGICSMELLMGRALKARGHRVRYVLCDRMLPACEVKMFEQEHRWTELCAKCYLFGKRLFQSAGDDILWVSDLIENAKDPGEWNEYVESALLKHYRLGVLPDTPDVQEHQEKYRQASRVSEAVARALVAMGPDRVIMSHGIYCTWGPAREVLNEANIPVMTHGRGKKRDSRKLNWRESAGWWDVSEEWEKVRDKPLTESQEARIDAYLDSRRDHSQDMRVYNFGEEETVQQTRERLDLAPDKQTFVLFTNVLWDAASAQREIAFQDPIDWVMETISWFGEHPDKQLVVKIHPAEVVIGTNQPFAALIRSRFPELPANVRLIEPQEKVNSWSIMHVADLGLVHTSTVGMELPLEGIPCLVVSRTHFRDRGFTIDVNSREEYFRRIETWDGGDMDLDEMKDVAKRYAFLLFERYQLHFPFFCQPIVGSIRALLHTREEELLQYPGVQVFLHGFEDEVDFLYPE
jgi:hypothetical protein